MPADNGVFWLRQSLADYPMSVLVWWSWGWLAAFCTGFAILSIGKCFCLQLPATQLRSVNHVTVVLPELSRAPTQLMCQLIAHCLAPLWEFFLLEQFFLCAF